jgi:hypothetical protein
MIAQAYPELRRRRVGIAFGELGPETLFRYAWDQGRFSILVGEEFRKAPAAVLEGGIAHELAHLVRDGRHRPPALHRAFERYERSRCYRIRDERATDRLAIDRGFGPQLLAMMRWSRAHGVRFRAEDGLHSREIAAHCRRARPRA